VPEVRLGMHLIPKGELGTGRKGVGKLQIKEKRQRKEITIKKRRTSLGRGGVSRFRKGPNGTRFGS